MSTAAGGLLKPRVSTKMHPKVTGPDVIAFFQQLSTLFRAGTPLLEALQIASMQTESVKLQTVIKTVASRVASGAALNEALEEHPKYFKQEWVEVVRSGEECGEMGDVFQSLTAQMDAAAQLKAQLTSAMMYPLVIMIVAVLAVTVMLIEVVPTFAQMFDSFGKELPGITQAVLELSDFLGANFAALLGGVIAVILSIRHYIRTPGGKRVFHKLLVCLPLVGDCVVQACMQKFANNMALLLRAGLPLHNAIHSLQGIFNSNVIYQAALTNINRRVGSGGKVADALEESGLFTPFVSKMVRIGEESGTLIEVLDQVDLFYKRKVASVVGRVTGVLETLSILGMGVAVAVILCAIYLPLFSMASGV
ncbi:MAG: type II secretion system F family protein [Planctomycetota bacterium]|nr:type II secretion system F family protein [Planctomycetota bacterium]